MEAPTKEINKTKKSGAKRSTQCSNDDAGGKKKQRRPSGSSSAESHALLLTLEDPRIWRLVALSRCLETTELGKLLLLTSKSICCQEARRRPSETLGVVDDHNGDDDNATTSTSLALTGSDDPWQLLCFNHLGLEATTELLRATQMDAKSAFFAFVFPPEKAKEEERKPLKYSPKDYALVVKITKFRDHLLVCKTVSGETIPDFFVNGSAKIELGPSKGARIKEIGRSFKTYEDFHDYYDGRVNWEATVQLMRKSDRKVIKLLDFSMSAFLCHDEKLPEDTLNEEPYSWGGEGVSCNYRPSVLPPIDSSSDEIGGIEMELRLGYRVILGSNKTEILISSIELSTMLWRGHSCSGRQLDPKDLEGKDSTFAHILEELHEWNEESAIAHDF